MLTPSYIYKPIGNIATLSKCLDTQPNLLIKLSKNSTRMYRHVPQLKKSGEKRDTYDAHEPLKTIQRKVVDRILVKVKFPKYLHGGIKDRVTPRSIYTNALPHCSSKNLILLDIKDFFPSITEPHVFYIFLNFFKFSPHIAKLLTKLTTYKGVVPQGASTSGYLANLLFWDIEAKLVEKIASLGFTYTRFADDITISSKSQISPQEKTLIISSVTKMLAQKGCKQKRSKLHIRKKGQLIFQKNEKHPITITGLNINNKSPSISKSERRNIRSAVHELEARHLNGENWDQLEALYRSTMGRIGRLIACNHPDGQRFKKRANKIKDLHKNPSNQ